MKYQAFIVGLLIAFGVWLAGVLGIFRLPEAILYDYSVRLTPEIRTTSSDILLVEAENDDKNSGDDIWLSLLEILETMGAEQVVFTFLPKHVSKAYYQTAEQYSNVLFGREILVQPHRSAEFILEPLPTVVDERKLRFGLITIPSGYHGIHREQYTEFLVNRQHYPSLERVASQTLQPDDRLSEKNTYLVNFNGKFNGLPKISLERVLSEDIVAGLVQGKHVIIGFEKSPLDPGLHTPLTPVKGMSLLEFHGHALDTLLADKLITEANDGITLVLITVVVLIGFVAYQFGNIRFFSWFALLIMVVYAFMSWVAFSYFFIWLPVTEILIAHVFICLFLFLRSIAQHEKATYKMVMQTSVKVRERVLPESFYDTQEYWTQIINMVNQILELNRAIFLEARQGKYHVREIKALHCSLSDIGERRRDYRRTPYSTAIRENGPIKLESFLFLNNVPIEEEQYLVPLMFGGRVLGFWAFGIEPPNVTRIANFNAVVTDFAEQISELLYRREHKYLQNLSEKGLLKYLRLEGGGVAHRGLHNSIALLERRLNLLETVFDGISTAVIFYNLFGQVLHVNKHMAELMQNSGLTPYTMTATDFASKISRLPIDKIRHVLRRLVFEHEPISLPAVLPSEPNKHYMLSIRLLIRDERDALAKDAYPFHAYGILFELLEITELKMFNQLKDELFNHLSYQLRRDFESIVLAYSILEENNLSREDSETVFTVLHNRIGKMLTFIKQVGQNLLKDTFMGDVGYYPIHLKQPIDSAIRIFTEQADQRGITFEIEIPESVGMVCAKPEALADVMETILTVLITDAMENSQIRIDVIETVEDIIYSFSNTGFGMPNNVFQRYLSEESAVSSPEFRRLREAIQQVRQWGGNVRSSSEVGVGTQFHVHLKSGACPEENRVV